MVYTFWGHIIECLTRQISSRVKNTVEKVLSSLELVVRTSSEHRVFLNLHWDIYQNNAMLSCHLDFGEFHDVLA